MRKYSILLYILYMLLVSPAFAQLTPTPQGHILQDETTTLPQQPYLSFAGAGVSCVNDAAGRKTTCTIAGGGAAAAPGSDTQVLFNDSGLLGADAGFTYAKATDRATLGALTLNGTSTTALLVDTTSLVVDATNHRVGVGTAPGSKLHIQSTYADPGADSYATYSRSIVSLTGANTRSLYGVYGYTSLDQAGQTHSTGTVTGVEGFVNILGSSGTVGAVASFKSDVTNATGSTITAATGFLGGSPSNSGTITTYTGFYQPVTTSGSTIRAFRGAIASAANRHNLYMDGTADNFLAGNVGIGSGKTAPAVAVDVNGVINAGSGFQVGGITLYQTCNLVIGADNGSALADADIGPQGRQCFIPNASTLVEITIAADGGTPNVIPRRNRAGSTANFVSSALATAASGGLACSRTAAVAGIDGATTCAATLQNTGLNAGDWIELGSGTAGGTAKRLSVSLTWSTP